MTQTTARNVFIISTAICSALFLYLSYDSLKQMPRRTNEDKLTAEVVAGKRVWQKYNCNDCHTILGIGGYYAPDITKVAKYRDHAWIERFLKDPEGVWPAKRKMPNLHLTDTEVDDLASFITWVGDIDTNGWPPKPMMAEAATVAPGAGAGSDEAPAREGARLFMLNGCQSCHAINGAGGKIGPDLTHVGSRLPDAGWHMSHLKDPRSVKKDSAMPSFATLPDKQLEELAEYLVSLK